MSRPADADLIPLPHPVRVDAAVGSPLEEILLKEAGVLERVRPHLASDAVSTEWIINEVPGMLELTMASVGTPAGLNAGLAMLMLARARLRARGDPILQVAESLHAQLVATDLGSGLPAGFFRSPYPVVYIELARPSGLEIHNRASGLHEVEGTYIGSYRIAPYSRQLEGIGRVEHLRLDPARETRVMELTITGSPVGKDNPLDDASVDISLFIQDDDACLVTLLERHIDYYRSGAVNAQPGFEIPEQSETDLAAAVIRQLAKVLLYLNLPDAEQAPLPERSRLEKRLGSLGPKKAARIKRRMATAYDRNLLGIDPDGQIHIAESVLAEHDGPTLEAAIKEYHGRRIQFRCRGMRRIGRIGICWRRGLRSFGQDDRCHVLDRGARARRLCTAPQRAARQRHAQTRRSRPRHRRLIPSRLRARFHLMQHRRRPPPELPVP